WPRPPAPSLRPHRPHRSLEPVRRGRRLQTLRLPALRRQVFRLLPAPRPVFRALPPRSPAPRAPVRPAPQAIRLRRGPELRAPLPPASSVLRPWRPAWRASERQARPHARAIRLLSLAPRWRGRVETPRRTRLAPRRTGQPPPPAPQVRRPVSALRTALPTG